MPDPSKQDALNELQKLNVQLLSNGDLRTLEVAIAKASDTLRVSEAFYLSVLRELNSRSIQPERSASPPTTPPSVAALANFVGARTVSPRHPSPSSAGLPSGFIQLFDSQTAQRQASDKEKPFSYDLGGGLTEGFKYGTDPNYEKYVSENPDKVIPTLFSDTLLSLMRRRDFYSSGFSTQERARILNEIFARESVGEIIFDATLPNGGQLRPITDFGDVIGGAPTSIGQGVLRQTILETAAQLRREGGTGVFEIDTPTTAPNAGRAIIGGLIGAVVEDTPGAPLADNKKPRPAVDNRGNVLPPSTFLDQLFQRNPPDP